MRVAIVQSETRIIGGIERITECLLSSANWRFTEPYVVFLRSGPMVRRVSESFPAERIAIFEAGRLRQFIRTIGTIARIARKLHQWKIDVVLSQGFHSQCYGGPAARLAGAKNVFWCHALLGADELRNPIARLSLNLPVDLVLGNCAATTEALRRFYGNKRPVELLYPCASLGNARPQIAGISVRDELHIPAHALVVTMVGRLQSWKGQDVFLRAAAMISSKHPNCYFLVVGGPTFDADREYESGLKELANELRLDGRVIFTGQREDVADLLGASDVVAHTSVAPEPFGMVIAEAMVAGKPVIATRAGGPCEIIADGRTGFLTAPGDYRELAAKISELICDSGLRQRVGCAARTDALCRFSSNHMTEELEQHISSHF